MTDTPTPVIPAQAGTQGDDDEPDPQLFCEIRNAQCDDDLCADFGCALEAGMEPDRDDGYISIDELVPALPNVRRRKARRTT